MRYCFVYILAALIFIFAGCAGSRPAAFKRDAANPEVLKFFIGRTRSAGVLEKPNGNPSTRITTQTVGVLRDSIVHIEQDLFPEGGKKNHRSFTLVKVDEHHIDGTGSDITGTANGTLYGNDFNWSFRLKLANRKFVKHVRMSQWMYLMPDGKTMIIRSVIRKFGMVVAQITEEFEKY